MCLGNRIGKDAYFGKTGSSRKFKSWLMFFAISYLGETGTCCHMELIVKKLITQSIYVKNFLFYTIDCWRNIYGVK